MYTNIIIWHNAGINTCRQHSDCQDSVICKTATYICSRSQQLNFFFDLATFVFFIGQRIKISSLFNFLTILYFKFFSVFLQSLSVYYQLLLLTFKSFNTWLNHLVLSHPTGPFPSKLISNSLISNLILSIIFTCLNHCMTSSSFLTLIKFWNKFVFIQQIWIPAQQPTLHEW